MSNLLARLDELTFGFSVVEAKKYRADILLLADGALKEQKGGPLMFASREINKR